MTRGRLVWSVLFGLLCSVGAGVLPLVVPSGWDIAWKIVVATVVAALAGASGSYFGIALAEREARKGAREQVGRLRELAPDGGPAGLLAPGRRIVEFVGRRGELAELLAWCECGPGRIRLVTGPGGVGKSRLAVELADRLSQVGWRCEWVADGAEADAVGTVRGVSRGRVLLVVDYAEIRTGLGTLLRAAVADDGAALRVLLLARSAGDWWDRLKVAEPVVRAQLADAYSERPLGASVETERSDVDLVLEAVPRFAEALGVDPPARVLVEPGRGATRILDLHATALVAVLHAIRARETGGEGDEVRVGVADVFGELLAHEERYWLGTAELAGLLEGTAGLRAAVLGRIVAAGCLLGALSESEAVALLERVPGAAASLKVAGWLRDLYPPHDPEEWLGSLQPDRLAEHLTIAQLNASTELTNRCLTELDHRQALRAITLLGRAGTDQPDALPLLERTLPLLDHVIGRLPPDPELLMTISNAIPYPSVALAETDVTITRRGLALVQDDDPASRVKWLGRLLAALVQTRHHGEALLVGTEAVRIWRDLAQDDPEECLPRLATALSNLGAVQARLDFHEQALDGEREAVRIWRDIGEQEHHSELAASLSNLGNWFNRTGSTEEALDALQEAVRLNLGSGHRVSCDE
ncbi:tetratricopeptide repeat protein [Nonomuraea sp. NPDC049152]|uniref:tetratricopeptide repeat protein n=1 Tax=Nonomuraea sp. NPDC049152 TaxID=3154350 RepID=UPI0033C9E6BE